MGFLGNQTIVPADKKIVPVQIRSADLRSKRILALQRHDHHIGKQLKLILLAQLSKPFRRFFLPNARNNPDISGMQTRIPRDDRHTFDDLPHWVLIELVIHGAVNFVLFEYSVLVDDLNKMGSTPIILADLGIKMLLFYFSCW